MMKTNIFFKNISLIILPFLLLIIVSCENKEQEGFTKTNSNLLYKRTNIGEDAPNISKGDIITANIYLLDNEILKIDSALNKVLKKSIGNHHFKMLGNENDGGIEEALRLMTEDDSLLVIIKADKLVNFAYRYLKLPIEILKNNNIDIPLSIKVSHHYPLSFYKNLDEEFAHWEKNESVEFENQVIKSFSENNNINFKKSISDILVSEKVSERRNFQYGDMMYLHYKGYFLNGEMFDNSYINNAKPIEYIVGKPNQLIVGLEILLPHLQENQKIKIILPSYLAYGKKGSSTGIVPPDTPLYYELEILKTVKKS
jgi:FKBP-type peptidyl-prolyl cis-trans isomerase